MNSTKKTVLSRTALKLCSLVYIKNSKAHRVRLRFIKLSNGIKYHILIVYYYYISQKNHNSMWYHRTATV